MPLQHGWAEPSLSNGPWSCRLARRAQNLVETASLVDHFVNALVALHEGLHSGRVRRRQHELIAAQYGPAQMSKELPIALVGRGDVVDDDPRPMGAQERLQVDTAIADGVDIGSDYEKPGPLQELAQETNRVGARIDDGDDVARVWIHSFFVNGPEPPWLAVR